MIVSVFTIYDNKALTFGSPFTFAHAGQALRAFQDVANDPNSMISRHPNDYSLIRIGTFDEDTGVMTSEPHQSFGPASQFKREAAVLEPQLPFPSAGHVLTDQDGNTLVVGSR